MSIEKNTKNTLSHEDGGFTTVLNETLHKIQNTSALGVYCYLASKPSGWEICKIELQNHFNCGKSHINSCFRYLKKIRAIEITMIRNSRGQAIGWDTKLKRKINVPNVHFIQNTENQHSGESSRIPETQILEKPESGKSALINNNVVNKKSIIKKTNNKDAVSVFSDSCFVKEYIEKVVSNRKIQEPLDDDVLDQGTFYSFTQNSNQDFDSVNKRINIFLKLVREGKWLIPQGWKGITTQSIRESDENYEKNKSIQQELDRKIMSTIKQELKNGIGFQGFQQMCQILKGSNNVKGTDRDGMQENAL